MDKRLKQQLDFVLEIDKEKNILRQTHLSGHGRRDVSGAGYSFLYQSQVQNLTVVLNVYP